MQPDAPALARPRFATRHLWVTAYDPDQLFAARPYPYQHPGGAGLPEYPQAIARCATPTSSYGIPSSRTTLSAPRTGP